MSLKNDLQDIYNAKNDIKDAIEGKLSNSIDLNLMNYAGYINNIQTGTSLNNQQINITENGTYTPNAGYTGFNMVNVNVDSIPNGIFIRENAPTKTTSEALWLKEEIEPPETMPTTFTVYYDNQAVICDLTLCSYYNTNFITRYNNSDYHYVRYATGTVNGVPVVWIYVVMSEESLTATSMSGGAYYNLRTSIDFYNYGFAFNLDGTFNYQEVTSHNTSGEQTVDSFNDLDSFLFGDYTIYITGTETIIYGSQFIDDNEAGLYIDVDDKRYVVHTNKTNSWNKIFDTADADANAGDILTGKTAYKNNTKLTGTMNNLGDLSIVPNLTGGTYGSGFVNSINISAVNSSIDSNITAENIVNGVNILGVIGSYSVNLTNLEVTSNGTYTPTGIYSGFNSVTVNVPSSSVDMNIFLQTNEPITKQGIWINTISQAYNIQEINEWNALVNYGINQLLVVKGFDINTKVVDNMTYYFNTVVLTNDTAVSKLDLQKYYGNGTNWVLINDGLVVLTPEEAVAANSELDDILGQPDQGDTDNLTPEEDTEANEIADDILGNSSNNAGTSEQGDDIFDE